MAQKLLPKHDIFRRTTLMLSVIRSGMSAAMSDIGVTSNNIANARTTGFKKRETSFADVYVSSVSVGVGNRIGSGVITPEIRVTSSQGNLKQTGDVLDLAIEGQGMFTLLDTNAGLDNKLYTRDGSFSVDQDGDIATPEGYKLMSSTGTMIRIPPRAAGVITADGYKSLDDIALTGVVIRSDGTVEASYGPDQVFAVGKVGLSTFADANLLTPVGQNLFRENPRSGQGQLGAPVADGRGKIHSGALEMSNTDMTDEMAKLIKAQQAFSGSSRLMQSEGEMIRRLLG
ncbi:MAG: flagellar hook basal-body protein [Candidatus Puniceispirillum sp.]